MASSPPNGLAQEMKRSFISGSGGNRNLFFLTGALIASAASGSGAAQKQPRSIGEHKIPADRLVRPILGLIGIDTQLGPHRYGPLRDT